MPICTHCTQSIPYLYTVYESEYNLRLEQCPNPSCQEFVDPYVEHDSLTILLDLFLLKRGVYRHLLYNRGSEPNRLTSKPEAEGASDSKEAKNVTQGKSNKELTRWLLVLKLGVPLVLVDSFIRWGYLNAGGPPIQPPWTMETLFTFLRVFMGTAAETIAFHGGIILSCFLVMRFTDLFQYWRRPSPPPKSSIRQHFHLSLISISLFYSSLTKLFLLFLLTIWLPTSSPSPARIDNPLPEWTQRLLKTESKYNYVMNAMEILDDDKLDREWIVRNIVGGMSAGFGLRIILDIHPAFTTIIILSGWAAKTVVATLVSRWVGGDETTTQAWLAYSIP